SLKTWRAAYGDNIYERRPLVFASPEGRDAKTYATQISLALDRGSVFTDGVEDFKYGDATYSGAEHAEMNCDSLKAHDANVTVWGSDSADAGDPLDQALLAAF